MNYLFNFDTILANINELKEQAVLMTLDDFSVQSEPFLDKSNINESLLKMDALRVMDDKTFCEFMDQYKSHFLNLRQHATEMTEDTIRILDNLKQQGSLLFLISSETTLNLKQILQRIGQNVLFDDVYGSNSNIHYKPHPQIIETILKSYHLSKHELMIVGSTLHDIKMGQHAGIMTCILASDLDFPLAVDRHITTLFELIEERPYETKKLIEKNGDV